MTKAKDVHELVLDHGWDAHFERAPEFDGPFEDVSVRVPRDERDAGARNAPIDFDVDRKDPPAHGGVVPRDKEPVAK